MTPKQTRLKHNVLIAMHQEMNDEMTLDDVVQAMSEVLGVISEMKKEEQDVFD